MNMDTIQIIHTKKDGKESIHWIPEYMKSAYYIHPDTCIVFEIEKKHEPTVRVWTTMRQLEQKFGEKSPFPKTINEVLELKAHIERENTRASSAAQNGQVFSEQSCVNVNRTLHKPIDFSKDGGNARDARGSRLANRITFANKGDQEGNKDRLQLLLGKSSSNKTTAEQRPGKKRIHDRITYPEYSVRGQSSSLQGGPSISESAGCNNSSQLPRQRQLVDYMDHEDVLSQEKRELPSKKLKSLETDRPHRQLVDYSGLFGYDEVYDVPKPWQPWKSEKVVQHPSLRVNRTAFHTGVTIAINLPYGEDDKNDAECRTFNHIYISKYGIICFLNRRDGRRQMLLGKTYRVSLTDRRADSRYQKVGLTYKHVRIEKEFSDYDSSTIEAQVRAGFDHFQVTTKFMWTDLYLDNEQSEKAARFKNPDLNWVKVPAQFLQEIQKETAKIPVHEWEICAEIGLHENYLEKFNEDENFPIFKVVAINSIMDKNLLKTVVKLPQL